MGESNVIANLDKKEFINPHHLHDGAKLWEFAFREHGPTNIALALLLAKRPKLPSGEPAGGRAGSWCGNRIVIVGEYESSPSGSEENLYEVIVGMKSEYANISVFVAEMVRAYLAAFNPPHAP